MRIIGGSISGRVFRPPKGLPVRPTTDQSKEALFNILNHVIQISGSDIADIFSGTGNMALEFASRDAMVTAIDQNAKCVNWIKEAASSFGLNNIKATRSGASQFVRRNKAVFDLIFMDPPYDWPGYEQLILQIFESGMIRKEGALILEHRLASPVSHITNYISSRKYGGCAFSFFGGEDSVFRKKD